MIFDYPGSNGDFFPLAHPSRSTTFRYTQNHDLEDLLLRKCVSNETIKKSDMIFNHSGSNVENIFSTHAPLSHYRIHIHTYFIK